MMNMKNILLHTVLCLMVLLPIPFDQVKALTIAQPDTCTNITTNIKRGMRDYYTNGSVSMLQAFLHRMGYLSVEPTGYFGVLTFKAVQAFQASHAIPHTGFVGPLTRAKIQAESCGVIDNGQLIISLVPEKRTYQEGEVIRFTLTVHNVSNEPRTISFNNGCQTSYLIDGTYNSIAAMMCTMVFSTKTLLPNESVSWDMEHDPQSYELNPGTHTITGTVHGLGSVSEMITVR